MGFSEEEIKEFQVEADELLDLAEKSLLALDQGGDFREHYDSVFRAFHSIKGAAGMMELVALQSHMHYLENTLTEQKSASTLAQPYIDLFLRGTDGARDLLYGRTIDFDYSIDTESGAKKRSAGPVATVGDVRELNGVHGRVLFIGENTDASESLISNLIALGYAVEKTGLQDELSEVLRSVQPDVILASTEILDGRTNAGAIQKLTPDTPIIVFSNVFTKEQLLSLTERGIFGALEQPFELAKVASVCIGAINKNKSAKLLNSSINLFLYQFSDLEEFLVSQDKQDLAQAIKAEFNQILEGRRALRPKL